MGEVGGAVAAGQRESSGAAGGNKGRGSSGTSLELQVMGLAQCEVEGHLRRRVLSAAAGLRAALAIFLEDEGTCRQAHAPIKVAAQSGHDSTRRHDR
jgi:hypothetical protein